MHNARISYKLESFLLNIMITITDSCCSTHNILCMHCRSLSYIRFNFFTIHIAAENITDKRPSTPQESTGYMQSKCMDLLPTEEFPFGQYHNDSVQLLHHSLHVFSSF